MNAIQQPANPLRQWALWSPACAVIAGLALGAMLLRGFAAPNWVLLSYLIFVVVMLWWIAPRCGFHVSVEGETLRWRWGMLHHDIERHIALADIQAVEVITLPDQPKRHMRTVDGMEIHGGNFTPSLNRGVLLHLRDGRRICLGLPEPDRFAKRLRSRLSVPMSDELADQHQ
jgi:hypothetical protein